MTVLYKNDLETANSLAALNALDNEEESAQKLIEAISNFIEESNFKLKGETWDKARSKLSSYIDALNLRIKVITGLKANIKRANDSLINYMGIYTELNTDKLEELLQLRKSYENNVYSARIKLHNLNTDLNEKDGATVIERNRLSNVIRKFSSLIDEINPKIEKIEKLGMADINAYSILSDTISDIASYSSKVSSISTGFNSKKDVL